MKPKPQTYADDFEVIDCPESDPLNDFYMEQTGHYLLIRTNKEEGLIEVAVANKKHVILREFKGKSSRDVYTAIRNYEKKHNNAWLTETQHIAYLGKELARAELFLKGVLPEYIQG